MYFVDQFVSILYLSTHFLGIRSQSRPQDIMSELYRAMTKMDVVSFHQNYKYTQIYIQSAINTRMIL